jgi:TonB family protein
MTQVELVKGRLDLKRIFILCIFWLVGCASSKMEVVNNDNRCEEFERGESSESKFGAFENSLKRVAPKYPLEAARSRLNGYVIMVFDITEIGTTDNIQVTESYPSDIFAIEARRALSQWIYKPAEKNGSLVRSICHKVQLDFKIE